MIVCVCRNISSQQFKTEQELKDRVMQDDFKCGLCQLTYLKQEDSLHDKDYCTAD